MFGSGYHVLEEVRAGRERDRENAARYAYVDDIRETVGWGEWAFDEEIQFRLAFAEEPAVSYGMALAEDKDLVDTRFPYCSGGVYRWHRDAKGGYVGAWVFVKVLTSDSQTVTSGAEPNYRLHHSFAFTGIAYKSFYDRIGE